MFKAPLAALLFAGLPGVVLAQGTPQVSGYQNTQPAMNLANPQAQTNDNQQPPEARRATGGQAIGQQLTQPIPNQNQPQTETDDNQQPPQARKSR